MTVMTFTVTTCAAIIAWKWQTEFAKSADKHLDTYQVLTKTVGVLFGLGAIIFWIFTYLTYKQVYRQRENRRYLPTEIGQEPKQPRVPFDVASLAVPVLTFGFRWMFDLCFHLSPKWAVTLCGFFTLGVLVPFAIYFYFNYLKSRKSQSYWFAGILIVLLVVAAFFCFSVIFGWNSDYLGWLGGLAVKPPQACLPFNRVPSTELKLSPPVMRCCLSRTAF